MDKPREYMLYYEVYEIKVGGRVRPRHVADGRQEKVGGGGKLSGHGSCSPPLSRAHLASFRPRPWRTRAPEVCGVCYVGDLPQQLRG